MIKGIGADIIEIERIANSAKKQSFLDRIFTKREQCLFHGNNFNTLAGNFAAKEAVAKALGTGFSRCAPVEIEILRGDNGKPYIVLYGNAKEIYDNMQCCNIAVTISHSKENAVAFAIIE